MRLLLATVMLVTACTAGDQVSPTAGAQTQPSAGGRARPVAGSEAEATARLPALADFARTTVELSSDDGRGKSARQVPVYVADDPDKRQRGLMGVESLPAGAGMVFRFPDERTGGFHMADTVVPLSIAFYDAAGRVLQVLDMRPCRRAPCPAYVPDTPYAGALEVNQGFFDEIGLEPGWRVALPDDLPAPS